MKLGMRVAQWKVDIYLINQKIEEYYLELGDTDSMEKYQYILSKITELEEQKEAIVKRNKFSN